MAIDEKYTKEFNRKNRAFYESIGYRTVNAGSILRLLENIKLVWDEQGFGDDDAVSEPIYDELTKAIEGLRDID